MNSYPILSYKDRFSLFLNRHMEQKTFLGVFCRVCNFLGRKCCLVLDKESLDRLLLQQPAVSVMGGKTWREIPRGDHRFQEVSFHEDADEEKEKANLEHDQLFIHINRLRNQVNKPFGVYGIREKRHKGLGEYEPEKFNLEEYMCSRKVKVTLRNKLLMAKKKRDRINDAIVNTPRPPPEGVVGVDKQSYEEWALAVESERTLYEKQSVDREFYKVIFNELQKGPSGFKVSYYTPYTLEDFNTL